MGRNYRWIASLDGATKNQQGFASGTARADDNRTTNYTPQDAEKDVRDFLKTQAPNSTADVQIKEV